MNRNGPSASICRPNREKHTPPCAHGYNSANGITVKRDLSGRKTRGDVLRGGEDESDESSRFKRNIDNREVMCSSMEQEIRKRQARWWMKQNANRLWLVKIAAVMEKIMRLRDEKKNDFLVCTRSTGGRIQSTRPHARSRRTACRAPEGSPADLRAATWGNILLCMRVYFMFGEDPQFPEACLERSARIVTQIFSPPHSPACFHRRLHPRPRRCLHRQCRLSHRYNTPATRPKSPDTRPVDSLPSLQRVFDANRAYSDLPLTPPWTSSRDISRARGISTQRQSGFVLSLPAQPCSTSAVHCLQTPSSLFPAFGQRSSRSITSLLPA